MVKDLLEKQGFKLLNRNIGCIEISDGHLHAHVLLKLNRNIGCIEILMQFLLFSRFFC